MGLQRVGHNWAAFTLYKNTSNIQLLYSIFDNSNIWNFCGSAVFFSFYDSLFPICFWFLTMKPHFLELHWRQFFEDCPSCIWISPEGMCVCLCQVLKEITSPVLLQTKFSVKAFWFLDNSSSLMSGFRLIWNLEIIRESLLFCNNNMHLHNIYSMDSFPFHLISIPYPWFSPYAHKPKLA